MFLVEKISNKIAYKIINILNLDKEQEEIMAYGAFSLIQFLWGTLWIVVFGIIFNVLIEELIIYFTVSVLRKYSGGVHASSPGRCILMGTTIITALTLIVDKIFCKLNFYEIIFIGILSLIFSYYTVYKLAPVDSPAKPITKPKMKEMFKKKSIMIINLSLIIMAAMLIIYSKHKDKLFINGIICIYIGLLWQSFTLTKKAHKILTKIDDILKNIL